MNHFCSCLLCLIYSFLFNHISDCFYLLYFLWTQAITPTNDSRLTLFIFTFYINFYILSFILMHSYLFLFIRIFLSVWQCQVKGGPLYCPLWKSLDPRCTSLDPLWTSLDPLWTSFDSLWISPYLLLFYFLFISCFYFVLFISLLFIIILIVSFFISCKGYVPRDLSCSEDWSR